MTQEMLIMAAILVAVILLTFIGILSRYRKCKSDEVLVVYGKTGGEKKSAKLYHGGAAFVWPIIQGYEFLSMKPMQIDCKLTGALSAQNIRVDGLQSLLLSAPMPKSCKTPPNVCWD